MTWFTLFKFEDQSGNAAINGSTDNTQWSK